MYIPYPLKMLQLIVVSYPFKFGGQPTQQVGACKNTEAIFVEKKHAATYPELGASTHQSSNAIIDDASGTNVLWHQVAPGNGK